MISRFENLWALIILRSIDSESDSDMARLCAVQGCYPGFHAASVLTVDKATESAPGLVLYTAITYP
jgi:hypothetical protein